MGSKRAFYLMFMLLTLSLPRSMAVEVAETGEEVTSGRTL